jgi:energy-coupling factor transport system substrate-specific component
MSLRLVPALSLAGIAIFVWPFLGLGLPPETPAAALAVGVALALLLIGLGTHELDNRRLALLAMIAALDAALRLSLVTGIAGFTPIFFLVICAGYVFGPSFGFLAGALAMLTSALATGGVGPWLPYQVFGMGWTGEVAGLAGIGMRALPRRGRIVALAAVGALLGYAYGLILDVWDWSFFRGAPDIGWTPDIAPAIALSRFARYYMATSLVWDTFRAAGNAVMILVLGPPVVLAMQRFQSRFSLQIEALPARPPLLRGPEVARNGDGRAS